MIPLLLLLPLLFLLAVYGRDSQKEQPRVVVIAIDGLRWQEVFEGARRDSVTFSHALRKLKEEHPRLMFVEFCETDYYGHHGKCFGPIPSFNCQKRK